ncbi:MAG: MarR family transcriptional regulator [Actinomycetota bacterium]|nr:MarR family transcriptional regulator [Actinomycetota bacterium]
MRPTASENIGKTTGYLLARVCKAHRGSVGAALAEVGLHVGQEMVLLHLWQRDELSPSELAERLGVEPPTVTNMLNRMERAGLLKRYRDREDARCARAYLTEKGWELREPVESRWEAVEDRAFAGISARERALLRRLLKRIHDNLTREPGLGE